MTSVHFITQGCSANIADTEVMAGLLREKGYSVVDNEDTDVVVFNSCTVKGPTESYFWKKLRELDEWGKKIIIAGCIPQSEKSGLDKKHGLNEYSKIGTYQLDKIVYVVEETLKGNIVSELSKQNKNRLNLPKIRKNPLVEIVPISQGCKSTCTFCKTKHARGDLISQKQEEIVRHVSKAVESGVKDVWLTSQDNAVYGFDISTNIVQLLKYVCSIDRDFMIRVGMANPGYMNKFLDEFVEVMKNPKIYKFVHVPVQAGSDKVLEGMNRDHTVRDYIGIVDAIRRKIPEVTIATDIIAGFPTETEEDFEMTMDLLKRTRPDVVNISKFWPRPGTKAEKMKPILGGIVKERAKKLMELFQNISLGNKKKWIGWEGEILISEKGKDGTMIGRNHSYLQVVVNSGEELLGKRIKVKVNDCSVWDLRADIL